MHPRRVLLLMLLPAFLLAAVAPLRSGEEFDEDSLNPAPSGIYFGMRLNRSRRGVEVIWVDRFSPAFKAGLRTKDLLVGIGEEQALSDWPLAKVFDLLREQESGRELAFKVSRDGETVRLTVVPGNELDKTIAYVITALGANRLFWKEKPEALKAVIERVKNVKSEASTMNEAYERLNEIVGSLGVSHTAIIPGWSYDAFLSGERSDERKRHLGFFMQRYEKSDGARGFFVRSVMPESPATRSDLRIGDEIVAVNGRPIASSPRLVLAGFESFHDRHAIRVRPDERVHLTVRRKAGGTTRDVDLHADIPLSGPHAIRTSAKLLETAHGPVGYIHFWNLLGEDLARYFERERWGKFKNARALIVDLRGRGGSVNVLLAVEKQLAKDGRRVVALIDSEARSAKEVLAYRLKEHHDFEIYGVTTAGAVRPGNYADLPDGKMMLPIGGKQTASVIELSDGVDLEGRGVDPTIRVEHIIPYSAGDDPILERALKDLEASLESAPRRVRL